jgi:hypothetical protein
MYSHVFNIVLSTSSLLLIRCDVNRRLRRNVRTSQQQAIDGITFSPIYVLDYTNVTVYTVFTDCNSIVRGPYTRLALTLDRPMTQRSLLIEFCVDHFYKTHL